MLIFWRYLLKQYVRIFGLALVAFLAILLVTRMHEIARIAAFGASSFDLFLFVLFQIPYILPIAVPISCLIASMLLFQRLSHTHELTAMRGAGFSLKRISTPIIFLSFILSTLNLFIVSEVSTSSHLASRRIVSSLSSVNPLALLQNNKMMKLNEVYVDMRLTDSDRVAEDVAIVSMNRTTKRLSLIYAKKLELDQELMKSEETTFFTSKPAEGFDILITENCDSAIVAKGEFMDLIKRSNLRMSADYLQMPLLLVRIQDRYQELKAFLKEKNPDDKKIKEARQNLQRSLSDISRRFSIALAPFTFTLLGIAFGIQIQRTTPKKSLFIVIGSAAFYLIAFFAAKSVDTRFWLSSFLYFFPHLLIVVMSSRNLKHVSRGVQ